MIVAFTGSRKVGNIACMQPNDIATPAQAGIRHSPPSSHRLSSSLFVEPGIDLRHQDRPKGKFPDLRFSRQSAQVAAG